MYVHTVKSKFCNHGLNVTYIKLVVMTGNNSLLRIWEMTLIDKHPFSTVY